MVFSPKQSAPRSTHSQEERERHEQESVSRVVSCRPATDLTRTPVARFNAKSTAIPLSDLFGTELAIYQNEDQPVRFLLFPLRSFGRRETAANSQSSRCPAMFRTNKSVLCQVTLPTRTQGTDAARFASDGTGHDGSLFESFQEFDDVHARKAAVQIEHRSLYAQLFQPFQEKFQNAHMVVRLTNELDRKRRSQTMPDDVGGRHTINARGAVLSFGSDPQPFCLLRLSVVGLVVIINCYLLLTNENRRRNVLSQRRARANFPSLATLRLAGAH